jgi:hypothetical protein
MEAHKIQETTTLDLLKANTLLYLTVDSIMLKRLVIHSWTSSSRKKTIEPSKSK